MFAVIKTGGKQYRVQAGDLLVVEKLDGDAGAVVAFNEVLMLGEGADVILGAPAVDGAVVNATLIETRKGEKVKIFKKIRRQGYRRTKGHRQFESVLRVTSVASGKDRSQVGRRGRPDAEVGARRPRPQPEDRRPGSRLGSGRPSRPRRKKAAAPKAAPKARPEAAATAAAAKKTEAKAAAPKKAADPKAHRIRSQG